MKKICFLLFSVFSIQYSSAQDANDLARIFSTGKWVDLTYSFSNATLYWPNNKINFHLDTLAQGITQGGFYYSSYQFCAPEHGGTHLDAPIHFAANRLTADQIPLSQLNGLAVVIDVSEMALKDRDYQVSAADFILWESTNSRIPDDVIVLIQTGYGKFYPDAEKYMGTKERGQDAVARLHFPGLHPDAANWLIKNRKVRAVGLDTPSIDYGQSKDFKTHQVLLGENIPVFENVANLDKLPSKGAYVIALPMKIEGGSGGPLRIVAWVK